MTGILEFEGHFSVGWECPVKRFGFISRDKNRDFGAVYGKSEAEKGAVCFEKGLEVASETVFHGGPVEVARFAVVLDKAHHEG